MCLLLLVEPVMTIMQLQNYCVQLLWYLVDDGVSRYFLGLKRGPQLDKG